MVNYLSKFSAHLSELAEPITELSKDKGSFIWGLEHQEAFKLIKKDIAASPILAYYNPRKTTVLQTEASSKGLGTCLLQEVKPVYLSSKALIETQGNRTRVPGSGLSNGEVSPRSLCQSFYS